MKIVFLTITSFFLVLSIFSYAVNINHNPNRIKPSIYIGPYTLEIDNTAFSKDLTISLKYYCSVPTSIPGIYDTRNKCCWRGILDLLPSMCPRVAKRYIVKAGKKVVYHEVNRYLAICSQEICYKFLPSVEGYGRVRISKDGSVLPDYGLTSYFADCVSKKC